MHKLFILYSPLFRGVSDYIIILNYQDAQHSCQYYILVNILDIPNNYVDIVLEASTFVPYNNYKENPLMLLDVHIYS